MSLPSLSIECMFIASIFLNAASLDCLSEPTGWASSLAATVALAHSTIRFSWQGKVD
jgi:hypothetical protein